MAVEVTVTFESGRIEVSPDPVRFDWTTEEEIRWLLESSDGKAELDGIIFKQHQKGPPFGDLAQHPSDKRSWVGRGCSKRRGQFKYDVRVRDGNGKGFELDPTVMTGDPPGRA